MKLRFNLKGLFIASAICAVISAFFLPPAIERMRAKRLEKPGVQLLTEPRGHFLLRQFLGSSFSNRVVYVHLDDPAIDDEWLSNLENFPYVENISIKSSNVTDAGLKHLESLPNLMSLDLVDTSATANGISKLRESARHLRRVEAYSSSP